MPLLTSVIVALGARRVALLDDARDPARLVADDAAVAVRFGELGREHGRGRAASPGGARGAASACRPRAAGRRRRAAARCRTSRQRRLGLQQRVARAELRRLHDELRGGPSRRERGAHLVGAVADDDHGVDPREAHRRPEHVLDEGPSGQRVQHLRPRRLHPRALAGRENHDVQGHPLILPRARRGARQFPQETIGGSVSAQKASSSCSGVKSSSRSGLRRGFRTDARSPAQEVEGVGASPLRAKTAASRYSAESCLGSSPRTLRANSSAWPIVVVVEGGCCRRQALFQRQRSVGPAGRSVDSRSQSAEIDTRAIQQRTLGREAHDDRPWKAAPLRHRHAAARPPCRAETAGQPRGQAACRSDEGRRGWPRSSSRGRQSRVDSSG